MMGEIAKFPGFTRVDSRVRDQINAETAKYLPYSDFNHTNILSWNLTDTARASMLNGNVVLCLPDYIDGTEFYSFLGDNKVEHTARTLLDTAEEQTSARVLRLVPEVGASALRESGGFAVAEDLDGHDYVISLPELVANEGSSYRHMRHEINYFSKRYAPFTTYRQLDITDAKVQDRVTEVFLGREQIKSDGYHANNADSELLALGRLFDQADLSAIDTYGLEIDGELKAFLISEKTDSDWVTGHFWKADTQYRGIYHYLMNRISKQLVDEGCIKLNIEQDLGLAGLRRMKMYFNPSERLRKYTVTDNC